MTKVFVLLFLALVVACSARESCAQTTEFTYQGSLKDGAAPANANYDFEFALFDALSAGSQIGATIPRNNVPVANGIFSVKLDFGTAFPGADRFLEVHVRQAGGGGFISLAPRQIVNSAPYSLKSLSAASADTVNAGNISGVLGASQGGTGIGPGLPVANTYLRSNGFGWSLSGLVASDIAGVVQVTNGGTGSATQNFVDLTNAQTIGGDKTFSNTLSGNVVNAATQYNLGNSRILGTFGHGLFAGFQAGAATTNNANNNAFFGYQAGASNVQADDNSFFGNQAGQLTTSGRRNSFFGNFAGQPNTGGQGNSFFGESAGLTNMTGSNNTLLGAATNVGSDNLSNATAIGANAVVSQSNSLVLGNNANVGIGTSGPTTKLHVVGDGLFTGNLSVNGTLTANLPTGSANYVQNTTSPQAGSNFNISGTGTANIFSATAQYNIGGSRILGNAGTHNLFVGNITGAANTTGTDNLFVGWKAGEGNTSGVRNSFVGTLAGDGNNAGNDNSFLGFGAGQTNFGGFNNSYFGSGAGQNSGDTNNNAFFGKEAGQANQVGSTNSFFGATAGISNTSGNSNTLIGYHANIFAPFSGPNPSNASAIGANAFVSQDNSLVLGSISGTNGATADTNVGIGTSAPISRLHLNGNSGNFALTFTNAANTSGRRGYRLAFDSDRFSFQSADDSGNFAANQMVIDQASGNVGIGTPSPNAKLQVAGGNVYIAQPNSLIITSPNGACWFITVNNAGALSTISVTCP